MSPTVAPTALRRALLAGAAAATAALGIGALAAPADAAFTLGRCQGSGTVRGQGASFQNGAQIYFKQVFETANGCGGSPAGPTYRSNGSGNGLAAMGAGGGDNTILCSLGSAANPCALDGRGRLPVGQRDLEVAYAATDEPPSPAQQQAINTGGPSAADDGLVHVIPVATGANVLIMHAPEGCELRDVVDQTSGRAGTVSGIDTGDSESNKTERIRLRSALVEKAFAATSDADTWGDIANGISGTPSNVQETGIADCRDVPVKRIVRQDNSGTTYAWKAYLNLLKGDRGWLTTYNPAPNTVWPGAGGAGTASPEPVRGAVNTDAFCRNSIKLCSGPSSGNGNLADTVNATDGSIGYVDLATARSKGFDITANPANPQDYTFWAPLENNPGGVATGYAEPTFDPLAHSGGIGSKGANCQSVTVQNTPTPAGSPNGDPTLGDWSRAFAAGGALYPACVLTYFLAWDDSAPVYGNTAGEEAEARTVKDYLDVILSGFGQQFANVDYSPLPNSVGSPMLSYAQTGAAAIGWNKSAGGGGGGGGGGSTPAPAPRGGGGGTTATPPSNQFSLPSSSTSARGLSFTVQLPGGGVLDVLATARVGRRTIRVASATARASAGGRVRVKLTLSSAARRALSRARGHKLSITVKFTFTPTGGTARTVTKSVTVRAAARRHHRRGGRR